MKPVCRRMVLVVSVAIGVAQLAAADRRPMGEIDFFGYQGFDLVAVRAALPFHEGDSFPPPRVKSEELKRQVGQAIKQVIGRDPTDVAFVCCDAKQHYMVYIGLPGESYQALTFNPAPTGNARFPKAAVKLSDELVDAQSNAVMNG